MSKKVKDQLDILERGVGASRKGRSSEIEIVRVKSKVNKKAGKCDANPYEMQQTVYDPCRRVEIGQILSGRINEDKLFIPDHTVNLAPFLEENEYYLMDESKNQDSLFSNKNLLILAVIVGGYFAYKKFKK